MNVAFVVPCYNESERMDFSAFKKWRESTGHEGAVVDFFFVNDGSRDSTLSRLVENFGENRVIDLEFNHGKAEAVRLGLSAVLQKHHYEYIGFLDADLATPLSQLPLFLKEIPSHKKVIIGSRILRLGGDIKRKWYRHYLGRLFATVASTLLELPVYDTQCGAKLFKSEVLEGILDEPFLSKWIFDVELFFRLKTQKKLILEDYLEIPLTSWEDIGGSRLKVSDFLKAPFELLKLCRRYL